MFAITCPITGRRSLLGMSQVLGVANDDRGVLLLCRCHCGQPAVLVTGRDRAEAFLHPTVEDDGRSAA